MFLNFQKIVITVLILAVPVIGMENDEFGYYEYHTKNRSVVSRDTKGVIALEIKPRPNESVIISDVIFNSPRSFMGIKIKIGDFVLSKYQTDNEFYNIINAWDKIVCECTIQEPNIN